MAADPARAFDERDAVNSAAAEALYANPPDGLRVEVLHGLVMMAPAPRPEHQRASGMILAHLAATFDRGRGGPGGWVVLPEPALELGHRPDRAQPDVAAWRRERLPAPPGGATISVSPDWICEVLSDSTEVADRGVKAPIYAEHGVQWLWFVDVATKTLEAYALEAGKYRAVGTWRGEGAARIAPFDAVDLVLADLWAW